MTIEQLNRRVRMLNAMCSLYEQETRLHAAASRLWNWGLVGTLLGFGALLTTFYTDRLGWFLLACVAATASIIIIIVLANRRTRAADHTNGLAREALVWLLAQQPQLEQNNADHSNGDIGDTDDIGAGCVGHKDDR